MAVPRFLLYVMLSWLLEEDLLAALRAGGLRAVWRDTRLLSGEFLLLWWPIFVGFGFAIETTIPELRRLCFQAPQCASHLRRKRAPTLWPLEVWPEEGEYAFFDGADIQWRSFREALPILLPVAALLAVLVRTVSGDLKSPGGVKDAGKSGGESGTMGLVARLLVGLGFVLYVHGVGSIFLFVLTLAFFATSRLTAGSALGAPCAWSLALLAVAAKEPRWPIRPRLTFWWLFGAEWAWLDAPVLQGEYDWAESVNLMVLRLLSFALDADAAVAALSQHAAQVAPKEGQLPSDAPAGDGDINEDASGRSLAKAEFERRYSLARSSAHVFYAPVFLAGPTIRFDDFADQLASQRPGSRSPRQQRGSPMPWYLAQLGVAMVMLEVATCSVPCFALARSGILGKLRPALGFPAVLMTLNTMWLKFLVIWRIARAWARADGIDPPENMVRSVNNHYSVSSFWQSWHMSFNKWLVRYIYIPAGGRKRRVAATMLTFLFVAYWHDAQASLMAWGGLNALFIALEFTVSDAVNRRMEATGLPTRRPWLYRQLCACGGAALIYLLMAVNMVGYSVGLGGVSSLLAVMASPEARLETAQLLAGSYLLFFICCHIFVEFRRLDGTFAAAAAKAAASTAKGAASGAVSSVGGDPSCGAGGAGGGADMDKAD